ncbi:hypothetical protein SUGI_0450200 [Cryptomeria japonica]|nr:hypothetical protein SUGI_0450200 [Cryptomeria japonica]
MAKCLHFLLLLFISVPCKALTITTSENPSTLTPSQATLVNKAFQDLLSAISPTTSYPHGHMFVKYVNISGKGIAVRFVRWSALCSVNPLDETRGQDLGASFKTLAQSMKPYTGHRWVAVSNRSYWLDYFVRPRYELFNSFFSFTILQHFNGENLTEKSSPLDCSSLSPARLLVSYPAGSGGVFNTLYRGGFLASPDGHVRLTLRDDCDVAVTENSSGRDVLWSTLKDGQSKSESESHGESRRESYESESESESQSESYGDGDGDGESESYCMLRLHSDGNMVLGDGKSEIFWETRTACRPFVDCVGSSSLVVENSGNVVLYRTDNGSLISVWATNTTVFSKAEM